MHHTSVMIHERTVVFCAPDLPERNLEFLRGLDGGYYEHVATSQARFLVDEASAQYGAAALRIAFEAGTETLLALMCAGMQAPGCVVGWMLSYQNRDLREMVRAMASPTRPAVARPFTAEWKDISQRVLSRVELEPARRSWLVEGFGTFWERLAQSHLDQLAQEEYNSLKHGTRAQLGGFNLSIGRQTSPDAPAPPENMRLAAHSEFGSTFFRGETLTKGHQAIRRVSINWRPLEMARALVLIAMSIENVTSFLRIINGDDPEECRFSYPSEPTAFNILGRPIGRSASCTIDYPMKHHDLPR